MPEATTPLLILGLSFTAPAPFREGHVCNANEARVLNTELAENLRNNFAKRVKVFKDKYSGVTQASPHELLALRQEFAAYAEQYSFGQSRLLREGDPVLRIALEIARPLVRRAWKDKGLDPANDSEGFNEAVAKVSAVPRVLEEAQRRADQLMLIAQKAVVEDAQAEVMLS